MGVTSRLDSKSPLLKLNLINKAKQIMDFAYEILQYSRKIKKKKYLCSILHREAGNKKSRIWETPNLLTDADSSTNIFFSAGVEKGADSYFWLD